MKNKKGFTLTEILLAVLIVGIIGVALASLTTAASRESGAGNSKVILRNNFSNAFRQIKDDVRNSSSVLYARGPFLLSGTEPSDPVDSYVNLLLLATNTRIDGTPIEGTSQKYIAYCLVPGDTTKLSNEVTDVMPSGSRDDGAIYRLELDAEPEWDGTVPTVCQTAMEEKNKLLDYVKYIPSSLEYPVPLFAVKGVENASYSVKNTSFNRASNLGSQLVIKMILELPSYPVINMAAEEVLSLSNGYADSRLVN